MPGLRDILDAATRGPWTLEDGAPWRIVEARGHFGTLAGVPDPYPIRAENDARLAALAPELAALVLDMGEELRAWKQWAIQSFGADEEVSPSVDALLARLDQLGKEQT